MTQTIFCDAEFPDEAERALREALAPERLVFAASRQRSNLRLSTFDPALLEATVAFGQPDVDGLSRAPLLRWVHLTSAGYTRYDKAAVKGELAAKGIALTTSSTVYADPCAE